MSAAVHVAFGSALQGSHRIMQQLISDRVASRLFARDATLWGVDAESEARIRLGWVHAWEFSEPLLNEVTALRDRFHEEGVDRVVLCGMGGSSLGPEVIARASGTALTVLDSTHPAQVKRAIKDLSRTVVVVSSKSGSTVETRNQLTACERAFEQAGIPASERIVIVTDSGSALEKHGNERGYRVFHADPNVGGRYSALTAFGLVPTVLAGADFATLLSDAKHAANLFREDTAENPVLQLAAALSAGLPQRYICRTVEVEGTSIGLADWIEQLIAESTGKNGHGLLPIALPVAAPELRQEPTSTITAQLQVSGDAALASHAVEEHVLSVSGPLGAQLLLWEAATAVLGTIIGVNPFDQPDVESAKSAARVFMEESADSQLVRPEPVQIPRLVDQLSSAVTPSSYAVIQAFLDNATPAPLDELRTALAQALDVPVALGFGPRYLHSTGQFHKGGPACGVFLQVLDPELADETELYGVDFARILEAQARGDRQVLEEQGRPVFRIAASEVPALLDALLTR